MKRLNMNTERAKVWRNIMVATTNAALQRGLISYPAPDEPEPETTFDFDIDGIIAFGHVRALPHWQEVIVKVILNPTPVGREFIRGVDVYNDIKRSYGDCIATGWMERLTGWYLQHDEHYGQELYCRVYLRQRLLELDVIPNGFQDHGPGYL